MKIQSINKNDSFSTKAKKNLVKQIKIQLIIIPCYVTLTIVKVHRSLFAYNRILNKNKPIIKSNIIDLKWFATENKLKL